jgi:hypothetical protein
MKGLFAWIGFPSREIEYDRDGRFAGETKWNYWRLWNFALEGITSFSVLPLKLASYIGFVTALGAFVWRLFRRPDATVRRCSRGFHAIGRSVPRRPRSQLGIMGEYLARVIFIEERPHPCAAAAAAYRPLPRRTTTSPEETTPTSRRRVHLARNRP